MENNDNHSSEERYEKALKEYSEELFNTIKVLYKKDLERYKNQSDEVKKVLKAKYTRMFGGQYEEYERSLRAKMRQETLKEMKLRIEKYQKPITDEMGQFQIFLQNLQKQKQLQIIKQESQEKQSSQIIKQEFEKPQPKAPQLKKQTDYQTVYVEKQQTTEQPKITKLINKRRNWGKEARDNNSKTTTLPSFKL